MALQSGNPPEIKFNNITCPTRSLSAACCDAAFEEKAEVGSADMPPTRWVGGISVVDDKY
jgi:hypothetical protein